MFIMDYQMQYFMPYVLTFNKDVIEDKIIKDL